MKVSERTQQDLRFLSHFKIYRAQILAKNTRCSIQRVALGNGCLGSSLVLECGTGSLQDKMERRGWCASLGFTDVSLLELIRSGRHFCLGTMRNSPRYVTQTRSCLCVFMSTGDLLLWSTRLKFTRELRCVYMHTLKIMYVCGC